MLSIIWRDLMPQKPPPPTPRLCLPETLRRGGTDDFTILAWRAVDQTIENGARRYQRARHLRPLLPLACPPQDMPEPDATRMVLSGLRRKLGCERRRARATPRSYDLNRHIALLQALRAEMRYWHHLHNKDD
jgi:Family of unknown function (DUF6477)